MRYILLSKQDGRPRIEGVTQNPRTYLAQFEPIDVVNKIYAVDEAGVRYDIIGGGDIDEKPTRKIAIVRIGEWDFEKGEPHMHKAGAEDLHELRTLLIEHLDSRQDRRRRKFFRKKVSNEVTQDYSNLTFEELLDRAVEK
jgi:hypothetical protein